MVEKRCPSVHSFFPFFSHKATLVLSLLAFIELMCPVAGNKCDGVAVVLPKGEVGITCPLTADVYQTKHSIVIKHFKGSSKAETVLGCDWLSSLNKFDCLRSRVRAELIGIQPDRVLARLPKDRLGDGKYRCQLVPPDSGDPFNDCDICDPETPTTSGAKTTTPSSKPATTTSTSKPATTTSTSKPATHANAEYLSTDKTIMTVIIVVLVLLVVIVLGLIVHSAIYYRTRHGSRKRQSELPLAGIKFQHIENTEGKEEKLKEDKDQI